MLKETVMGETYMRAAGGLLLALIFGGCATLPNTVSQMQMTARDGAVYHGTVQYTALAVVTITVEIDRRLFRGNAELTSANTTFGLYRLYGAHDAAPKTAETLSRTNYTRAILASTDSRKLTCDFTDVGGNDASGLCVDESKRVYDVVFR